MADRNRIYLFIICLFLLPCSIGCSTEEYIEEYVDIILQDSISVNDDDKSSNTPHKSKIPDDSLGRVNAVKKAYQMTDITFTPLKQLYGLKKTYKKDSEYKGLPYSMVSEMGNYIGANVSFHTFMTALHNPKSKLYSEDVSKTPYHGRNCKAYYGVVCSSLVSYALGIYPSFSTKDFCESDLMIEIPSQEIDSVKTADVLWKNGHVALITDISKDKEGHLLTIEISESVETGCRRYSKTRNEFCELMKSSFKKIYRYKELYKNINYISIPEFVSVTGEEPISFNYNDNLCVDKGDKSCYLEGDTVTVNVMHAYDRIEIYKDDNLYLSISEKTEEDVCLSNLPYGDYKARIFFNGQYSDFTYWKVVNINVSVDRKNGRVTFSSANAVPQYMHFRDIAGLMQPIPTQKYGFHLFTEQDITNGYVNVDNSSVKQEYPYLRVYFSTDYGTIINKPINWYE